MAHTLETVCKSTSPKKPTEHASSTIQDEASSPHHNQGLIIPSALNRTDEVDPTIITTVAAGYGSSHSSGSCTVREIDGYVPINSSDKNPMKHLSPATRSQPPLKRRRDMTDCDADGDSDWKKLKTVIERLDDMNKSPEDDVEHLELTGAIADAEHKKNIKQKIRRLKRAVLKIYIQLVKL